MKSPPPRAWQRMLSGRRLDLLDPSPLDIEIEDIAHGLARVSRWNGQTRGATGFSVAQHSLIVENFCLARKPDWPARWRLAALLHDAPEFVIGDMITPFKAQLGDRYTRIERGLQRAVHMRFGLPGELPPATARAIKTADKASAYYEAIELAGFEEEEARRLFGAPRLLTAPPLEPWPADIAQQRFLERFADIGAPR